jgi:hypothetical protein
MGAADERETPMAENLSRVRSPLGTAPEPGPRAIPGSGFRRGGPLPARLELVGVGEACTGKVIRLEDPPRR